MEIASEFSLSNTTEREKDTKGFKTNLVPIFFTTDLGETRSESQKPSIVARNQI